LGYLLADQLTGSELRFTLLMTLGNLQGVLMGWWLLSRLPAEDRRLQGPLSVPRLLLVVTLASATAALVGLPLGTRLLGTDALGGWIYCFASELANYIAFLPAMLTLPAPRLAPERRLHGAAVVPTHRLGSLRAVAPVLALVLACGLGLMVAGPGAVAFPVPALLWCALSYGVFGTAVLTLLFGSWALISISLGWLPVGLDPNTPNALLSIRLGVSMIAVAPITVACVMAAREQLLQRLHYLATHDPLSGLLNRHAFHERAALDLARLAAQGQATALLMLDLDHFKRINDEYGHAAGDTVLARFAGLALSGLREVDLMGRVGGEEFAILLPGCGAAEAQIVAERLRAAFAAAQIDLGEGRALQATVSIGVAAQQRSADLQPLLAAADRALYAAKTAGRNRVDLAPPEAALAD
jgi:diguanylate cyclase (GGDEF)-like protein